jgi:hypothetical protein
MSFQDVSNPMRTARLTRQHQLERNGRSERLLRTSPDRAIRVRGVSQQHSTRHDYEIHSPDENDGYDSGTAVLHGRIIHDGSKPRAVSTSPRPKVRQHYSAPSLLVTTGSSTYSSQEDDDGDALRQIRSRLQQRSEFAQLVTDIRHFQTLVKDLDMALQLQETNTSPEAAWRARILWTSAVETDSAVTQSLMEYEKSLRIPDSTQRPVDESKQELRTAQSGCLKLHRDVQRTHRSLQGLLAKYRQTQEFDIRAQLGSVAWSAQQVEQPAHEFHKMNETMHQVNDLVQELAGMVATQQDPINRLEENIEHAHDTVQAARREVSCTRAMEDPRDLLLCGGGATSADTLTNEEETYHHRADLLTCGPNLDVVSGRRAFGLQGYDRNISLHDNIDGVGESDKTGCDWKSQWESLKDGVLGLKDDLIFATQDLQRMATTQDLQRMATTQDLQRMASSSVSSAAEQSSMGDVDVVRTREG